MFLFLILIKILIKKFQKSLQIFKNKDFLKLHLTLQCKKLKEIYFNLRKLKYAISKFFLKDGRFKGPLLITITIDFLFKFLKKFLNSNLFFNLTSALNLSLFLEIF